MKKAHFSLIFLHLSSDFFKEYVEKNRPVVFKGLAKRSPAYKLFTDEFLKDFPGSKEFQVTAEPHKKEIRKAQPLFMSFHDFVSRYHNESLYMVNALPEELRFEFFFFKVCSAGFSVLRFYTK